jgi:DNA-directed RNA polymerase subunit N (RpoN/RPB10)
MSYLICPTCSTILGNRQLYFEKKKKEIKNECEIKNLSNDEYNMKIINAYNELKLKRYCCKMRIMTYIDLTKYIIPDIDNK